MLSSVYGQFWGYFKGTVMQIEKTQINVYMFQTCPENFTFQLFLILRNLPLKFAIFLTVSIVFFVYKQNITVQ